MSLVSKLIRCGKINCSKCPHGPYYYSVERIGSKVKFIYIGKAVSKSK